MSDIKLVRTHRLTVAQARAVAQRSADDLAREYDLVSEWHGDTLHFHRSGVEGHMRVTDREIALDVKLGFLLRAFKAKFEHGIARHLDELLAAPATPAEPAVAVQEKVRKPTAGAARSTAKPPPAKGGNRKV
jgi:putative polyhydroxyalkanoate system protein